MSISESGTDRMAILLSKETASSKTLSDWATDRQF